MAPAGEIRLLTSIIYKNLQKLSSCWDYVTNSQGQPWRGHQCFQAIHVPTMSIKSSKIMLASNLNKVTLYPLLTHFTTILFKKQQVQRGYSTIFIKYETAKIRIITNWEHLTPNIPAAPWATLTKQFWHSIFWLLCQKHSCQLHTVHPTNTNNDPMIQFTGSDWGVSTAQRGQQFIFEQSHGIF